MTEKEMSGLAYEVLREMDLSTTRSVFAVVQIPNKAGVWAVLFSGGTPPRVWTQVTVDQHSEKTDEEIKTSIRLQLEKATI